MANMLDRESIVKAAVVANGRVSSSESIKQLNWPLVRMMFDENASRNMTATEVRQRDADYFCHYFVARAKENLMLPISAWGVDLANEYPLANGGNGRLKESTMTTTETKPITNPAIQTLVNNLNLLTINRENADDYRKSQQYSVDNYAQQVADYDKKIAAFTAALKKLGHKV